MTASWQSIAGLLLPLMKDHSVLVEKPILHFCTVVQPRQEMVVWYQTRHDWEPMDRWRRTPPPHPTPIQTCCLLNSLLFFLVAQHLPGALQKERKWWEHTVMRRTATYFILPYRSAQPVQHLRLHSLLSCHLDPLEEANSLSWGPRGNLGTCQWIVVLCSITHTLFPYTETTSGEFKLE